MLMLGVFYSVCSYLAFLAVYVYFVLFSDGIVVPKSVDTGQPTATVVALAINVSLLVLFGLQHSVMARAGFKRALTRLVPAHLERATFVLTSSVVLAALMWLWQPLPGVLWSVESAPAIAMLCVLNAIGWVGVPVCSFMIDHFDLFGIKQPLQRLRKSSAKRTGFVTPLLYKYVRHPMMTCFLLAFWATPEMSLGHLTLSLGMSVYILVGVHFEERALRRELGADYARYQETTPMFVPNGAVRKVSSEGRLPRASRDAS
jgi:protein-S-isoprenylcysteine O-methyltransferase Ste14